MTGLLLALVLAADPCTPDPGGDAIEQHLALGPIFQGGVVLRATGEVAAVEGALSAAGITGAVVRGCPPARVVVWVPGGSAELVGALVSQSKLTSVERVIVSPSDGQAWLQRQCADPVRCEDLARRAHPDGLCGLTLSSRGQPASALPRCRALDPASVSCALRGEKKCVRAFDRALAR